MLVCESVAFGRDPEPAAEPASPTRTAVDIRIAGGASAEVFGVEEVLRERAAGTELILSFSTISAVDVGSVVAPGAASSTRLASVWIDLTREKEANIYVVDGTWERVLVRRIERHDNLEVMREDIGHVVELALGALRSGRRIGVAREQLLAETVPPPAPAPQGPAISTAPPARDVALVSPSRPRAHGAPIRLHAGAFFEAIAYGDGLDIATGPGLQLALDGLGARTRNESDEPRGLSYGVALTGQYRLPSSATGNGAVIRMEGGAVRALLTAAFPVSATTAFSPALGGGFDVTSFEGKPNGPSATAVEFDGAQTSMVPVLRASLRVTHRTRFFRGFLGAGLDVTARPAHFTVARAAESFVVYETWQPRPFVLAGIETP